MKEDWETNPPVDMEEALEIVDGDDELLKEIFDDFLEDYPDALAKIKEAVLMSDADSLYSMAHKLKGMLKNVGANTASIIASELEGMGKKQDQSRAGETLKRLDEVCKGLRSFIQQMKDRKNTF